ncbi:hypothetical protein WJX74_003247 [Apatococcus lobatus]|uniref:Uncharacterized protein n=1 Tax=Apatococcus lobatus TaxID=904363 RepID=A0AAW1RDE2_9CHLO
MSTAGDEPECSRCHGSKLSTQGDLFLCPRCGASTHKHGLDETMEFEETSQTRSTARSSSPEAVESRLTRVHRGPPASVLVHVYCQALQFVLLAVAEECVLAGLSCHMSPVAHQIWNSTVADAGVFTDSFLRDLSNCMEIDDKKMDDLNFPTRNVQRVMQRALSPDTVAVVLFITARWLQESLTSHDLLLACANGSLTYFPTFHEVCSEAEEELDGYPLRDFLIPTGVQTAPILEEEAYRLCKKLRLKRPGQNADLVMQSMLLRAGLPQVVHAEANLLHTLLSLALRSDWEPWFCFSQPAACVLMASNWLLNPQNREQAQHGRPPEEIAHLLKWAWKACSHTIAPDLDSKLLQQIDDDSIEDLKDELDFHSNQGLGAGRPINSLGEFICDFMAVAAGGTASHAAMSDADNLDEPCHASGQNVDASTDEKYHNATDTPASGQYTSNVALIPEVQPPLIFSRLMAEAPRLMLSETGADAVMALLAFVVGKSVGVDLTHLNRHMQVQEEWLAVASTYFTTSANRAGAAVSEDDPPASESTLASEASPDEFDELKWLRAYASSKPFG